MIGGAPRLLNGFTDSRSKRVLLIAFGELPAALHVRDSQFNICTVYATAGDLAGKLNTVNLKYANNYIFSYSHINGASRDGGAANMLFLLPLKSRSSADHLQFVLM